ncbi:hypothetical protein BDZ91DRAFT_2473 [Kalaharituber pfeilii]|nr:hypothetical protein BDZ91DRAFT_2473 [Kalaharituber pfeilii]
MTILHRRTLCNVVCIRPYTYILLVVRGALVLFIISVPYALLIFLFLFFCCCFHTCRCFILRLN